MGDSKNITATKGRLHSQFSNVVNNVLTSKNIPGQIQKAVDNEKIRTGVITKFYPYLDKAEVQLDNLDKTIVCKILHRFGGEMIDFFTPLEYESDYCENLHEPYIIPKAAQHVCVLNINDADSEENLILGYYQNEEIVGFDPAKPGNVKLAFLRETNEYWIEFGNDGLNIRLPNKPELASGLLDEEMEDVDYVSTSDVTSLVNDSVNEAVNNITQVFFHFDEI